MNIVIKVTALKLFSLIHTVSFKKNPPATHMVALHHGVTLPPTGLKAGTNHLLGPSFTSALPLSVLQSLPFLQPHQPCCCCLPTFSSLLLVASSSELLYRYRKIERNSQLVGACISPFKFWIGLVRVPVCSSSSPKWEMEPDC